MLKGNQLENVNRKGITPHLSLLHKQWIHLWTQIIAKWWHWRKLNYRWLGTTLHLPIKMHLGCQLMKLAHSAIPILWGLNLNFEGHKHPSCSNRIFNACLSQVLIRYHLLIQGNFWSNYMQFFLLYLIKKCNTWLKNEKK